MRVASRTIYYSPHLIVATSDEGVIAPVGASVEGQVSGGK